MRIEQHSTGLVVHTPAKLNLSLRVLGRRNDGYHELQTMFASVGIYDTISFEPADSAQISLEIWPASKQFRRLDLPADDRNLIVRAAQLLLKSSGQARGARIRLWKRIPVEAGLGGGSSDAAATLLSLNRLWGLNLTHQELHVLASQLGSDVNFFLESCSLAFGFRRGEAIQAVSIPQAVHAVIVKPKSGLSTRDVFEQLQAPPFDGESEDWSSVSRQLQADSLKSWIFNDLESVARRLNPEVDELLDWLSRQDTLASSLSGSGSACFALCRTRRQATALASRLRALNWSSVLVAQLLT